MSFNQLFVLVALGKNMFLSDYHQVVVVGKKGEGRGERARGGRGRKKKERREEAPLGFVEGWEKRVRIRIKKNKMLNLQNMNDWKKEEECLSC